MKIKKEEDEQYFYLYIQNTFKQRLNNLLFARIQIQRYEKLIYSILCISLHSVMSVIAGAWPLARHHVWILLTVEKKQSLANSCESVRKEETNAPLFQDKSSS